MVKWILLTAFLLSTSAQAAFFAGVQNNSWQDAIPVTYTDTGTSQKVTYYATTTFSTLSVSAGYENLFGVRWRWALEGSYHTGTADLLKIQGTVSPRKTISSQWLSAKVNYRLSKTFSIGPQLVGNMIHVPDAGSATSLGLLINSEIEMYDSLRFIQTFGTMNDSGTIAYTIGLQKIF
jgi:lipopolysaccharide assembly outer membrane protein LptD (OstA)